ncbi:MAG: hypothetical protein D6813_00510, partial [Calditrichaeota bacterium]
MALWIAADGDGSICLFPRKPRWLEDQQIWTIEDHVPFVYLGNIYNKKWNKVLNPGEILKLIPDFFKTVRCKKKPILWLAADGDGSIYAFVNKPYQVEKDKVWIADNEIHRLFVGTTRNKEWKSVLKPNKTIK